MNSLVLPAIIHNVHTAIRLTGVHKRFGETVAVRDLDLEIGAGEFFSVLGPSGSGKTTVLRLIAGFESATSGTVELFGQDVTARVIKIDRSDRRIGLSIKAANYSPEQLKAEQAVLDALKPGEDLVALQHAFDAADEAIKE